MVAIIRILVVDDSVVLRNMIVRMSQSLEYEVVGLACDGVEAIEQYKKLRPDVVTMDMSMPKLNGLEALKTILAYDALAKIIVVSAVNQKRMVVSALEAGAKHFITKPFTQERFSEVISYIV